MSPSSSIRPPKGRDIFILGICAALLASSFPAITLALEHLSPIQVATARCVIACTALWLWSWLRPSSPQPPHQSPWPHSLGVGILGYVLPFALLAWAETHLAAGHTAMLFCSGPIFAVLIAWSYQKDEKSSSQIFLGILLCTFGIGLLVYDNQSTALNTSFLPALAVLGCALCYALAGLVTRRTTISSDRLTRHSLLIASILLLGACALGPDPFTVPPTQTSLAALYLGLIPTALCSVIRYRQIQALGYTFVSQTGYLVPTIGALLGVLLFSETLSPTQIVGLALSLLGLWWMRRCMQRYSKNAAMRSSGRGGED